MENIINFITTSIRLTTPLLLASLGGAFTYFAFVPNMAMEGSMLISAFTAYVVSDSTGSWAIGLLAAILVSVIVNYIYSILIVVLKANNFAVGITLNIFLTGMAAFVLRNFFHVPGTLASSTVKQLPEINIPLLNKLGVFSPLLNGYSVLIPISILLVIVSHLIIYKTPYGFWLRAVGYNSEVLESAGRNPNAIKTVSFLINGVFCGLAGAHLALGYVNVFTLRMIAGRGFIALSIILFGRGNPISILFISLLFGISNTIVVRTPIENIPSQFMEMIPYVLTVVALFVSSIINRRKGEVTEKIF